MLSAEAYDALRAVSIGDAYAKARDGAQRAGRTRSLGSLLRRGLIASGPGIGLWGLTDAGRRQLPSTTAKEVQR